MSAPSRPDHPPHPDHDDMAEGLKAAFGAADLAPQRPSVLQRLQKKSGSSLALHLQDQNEESDVPVKIDDEAKALRDPSGRYQVLGEIGRGGVGVVYKGRDQELGRDVAMKVLRPEHVSRPEIVERFVEEAQIGGQLQHPGIVPVYEIGLQAGERPYFAMKLVKGHTLAALLAQRKGPDDERRKFLGIFEQVCQTIAYAHARRVVHRDIKPHNVMLGSFGEVQVVDWGFAKVLPLANTEVPSPPRPSSILSVIATVRSDPKKGSHSVAGSMMGTPAYMPPEQANGAVEQMDQRSDVFGLGAMLCEILTGQPPYLAADGDLIQQAARADLQGAHARLERCGADAVLIALCKQCLSPSRMARPDSAKQVAEAVAHYLTSVEERVRQAQIHAAEAKVRARATVMLSAAAVLLLALGGGGYLYLQHETQTRRDQANQRVAMALNEANARLGEARSKEPPDLALWARAEDAATQAEQLAGEADVGEEERAHAGRMLATVHDGQSIAVAAATRRDKDAAMQQRLLEVRHMRLDEQRDDFMVREYRRREQGYAAAFATYLDGRDLTTMSREDAIQALSGPLAVELASGVDCWCSSRRSLGLRVPESPPDPAITARLSDLASAIDPDPWRLRMRAALTTKERDHDSLVALHREADLATLPIASLLLLGGALVDVADIAAGQAVYERACERFPDDFASFFQLGLTHLNAGHFAQAETCFRIAHALRPDMLDTLHQLGKAMHGLGDFKEEERIARRLVERDPGNAHWPFHVALALCSQQRFDEAIANHQRAIEMDPKEGSHYINLGLCFDQLGRMDDAMATYRRAVEVDPINPDPHTNLGNCLSRLGRHDEALASYQRAVELKPTDAHAVYNLGLGLKELGRLDEAAATLQHAIELDPKEPRTHNRLGSVYMAQRRLEDAVACMRRAIELEPTAAGLHYDLGIALGIHDKAADAVVSYRRAIELDPDEPRYHMNLGNLQLKLIEPDEAHASYRRAASLWAGRQDAESVEWHEKALKQIAKLQPLFEQRDRLQAVLRGERESKDPVELCAAADHGYAHGDVQLAIRCFQLAIAIDPKVARYHANLAVAFERLGRFEDAIASYDRAIELAPEEALVHLNLGNALFQKGDLDDAIGSYRESLRLDPKNVEAWIRLGRVHTQNGEMAEAIAAARKAVELAPEQPAPVVALAVALNGAGQAEEAIRWFRKAVELDPSAINHHNLGAALVNKGRWAEGLPSYLKAVELAPDNAQGHIDLALTLQNLGEHDAALNHFRRAVELDPTKSVAHYNLGWIAQDEQHWDEAIAHYLKAIECYPGHAEAHCNLAMCLQNTGRLAEAVPYTRRGHELGSKRADWRYPSAEWVRAAEARAALEEQLPQLLEGNVLPADNAERLEYAIMCQIKKFHHASARLFAECFAADPKLAEEIGTLYDSAISPVQAAAGLGEDASQLDAAERARLRKQALDWIRTDLDRYAKKLETAKPTERTELQTALRKWQEEPLLASIRDDAALALLPDEEQDEFGDLWADVAELLQGR